jgi:arabinose-5-phosphate isomerase
MTDRRNQTARDADRRRVEEVRVRGARDVLAIEREALERVSSRLGPSFASAVRAILESSGTVIVLGVGKSGIVARKIAATFTSTGTPAVFLHPGDAAHGDVGMVGRNDVAIAVSKSGEGDEILRILPVFKGLGVPIIAITGEPASSLAREADVVLDAGVEREACPMDLVPTASTTAALALGDALAVVVLREKDVDRDLFAAFHPGGALGRRLRLRVSDVMHAGDGLPTISQTASMKDAIVEIADKRIGMTTVVDDAGRLAGIIADGDLKRILMVRPDILEARVSEVMTVAPRTIERGELVASALERMESNDPSPITSLIVVDEDGRPEGVIHIHDCLRAVRSHSGDR